MLFKKGSEQSDCAYNNFSQIENPSKDSVLCYADVNLVRDIHTEFNITSVPTLVEFENGKLKNTIKGCHQPEQFKLIFEKSVFINNNTGDKKPVKSVTVYTTPTCSWCTTVKRHLDANGIRYREVNVAADTKAAEEMVRKSGQQGVPQTDINGQIVVGFNKERINALLEIK